MSFSIEESLYRRLSKLVKNAGYKNRSKYVRDLIRDRLVAGEWRADEVCLGTITLVYNHHLRRIGEKLTKVQHHHHDQVLAATHVHLDHDLCAEVVIVKGRASEIRHLADELKSQKGVLHATLSTSTTGKRLT